MMKMLRGLMLIGSFMVAVGAVTYDSGMSPRLQWLANDGYCGEVSTISAGLKYGQYLSQYDMRDIATGAQADEYLVGVNDESAAKKVKLQHIEFDGKTNIGTDNYLAWIKTMARKGYAVTISVYMNYYLFYGMTSPTAGDAEYDHIVSVSSISSAYDDDKYHDEDVIVISDHGLWAPYRTGPVYLFNYTFKDFVGTREEANKKTGNTYTLPASSKTTTFNYGIAHTGIMDDDGVLLPVSITTNVNYEDPEMENRSEKRPAAMPLDLTITVAGLTPGEAYMLYRYSDETKVPTANFNSQLANAAESTPFTATKSTFVATKSILSNEKNFFRCVLSDAK
jgi:hypothetical protein